MKEHSGLTLKENGHQIFIVTVTIFVKKAPSETYIKGITPWKIL